MNENASPVWHDRVQKNMMNTFGMTQALLVSGSGSHVRDIDGKTYLDFLGGIAVNSIGHAHPALVEAISTQAAQLIHVSNFFSSPPQLELAERLKRLAGTDETGRVFFSNSGTEANEAALKLARLHGGAERPRVIALTQAFHGRTMGSLALTGKPAMWAPFQPLPGGIEHIEPTIEALEAAMDERVAAVFLEPIQGEAGVVPLPEGFLRAARELTSAHGALLILDEIQTGAGRTGTWFAFQSAGIMPDAFTLAKGIGGGVPIGAIVTTGAASALMAPGSHGTTFGGNPLVTAAANATLGVIENEGLLENVARRSAELTAGVLALGSPIVTGVRGAGLLLGIALAEPIAPQLTAAALEAGLIVNAANPSTVRIAPALNIGDSEVAEFLRLFGEVLAAHTPLGASADASSTQEN